MGLYLFLWEDNLAAGGYFPCFLGAISIWTPPVIAGKQLHLFYLRAHDDQNCLRTQSTKFNSNHSLLVQHMDQAAHFHFRIFQSAAG